MYFEIALSLVLALTYFVVTKTLARLLTEIGIKKQAAPQRAIYITKVFNFGVLVLAMILLTLIWGIDYGSVFVLASSVLAVIGVAFFAQWSILSNITASIVIFFSYPSRIGDFVRIVDGDNTLEGEILDINLFQVLLKDGDDNVINYPNNLIIQKPLVRLSAKPEKKVAASEEDIDESNQMS